MPFWVGVEANPFSCSRNQCWMAAEGSSVLASCIVSSVFAYPPLKFF